MKKIFIKSLITIFCSLVINIFTGCATTKINIWSFNNEVPDMIKVYFKEHPELKCKAEVTIIDYTKGEYQYALNDALKNPNPKSPDIYALELSHTLNYTKGKMNDYAMPFSELGFDCQKLIKENRIPKYTVEIGSNPDGNINGLCYQTTGGLFIYRRSIAKKVFGTDNPDEINKIIGGATGSWKDFLNAAKKLNKSGYTMISGIEDLWHSFENTATKGWIVNGELYIDPMRDVFMDVAKLFVDNGWTNNTYTWSSEWYQDIKGVSEKPVFGFFGPSWFVNSIIGSSCGGAYPKEGTYGDWAICMPPVGFFWGGTWIQVNKNLSIEKYDIVKNIINYLTLDTSTDGFLYKWTNGIYSDGIRDSVASGVVMSNSYYECPLLGNQNIFDFLEPADAAVSTRTITLYDDLINQYWLKYVHQYINGQCSKSEAIKNFENEINYLLMPTKNN